MTNVRNDARYQRDGELPFRVLGHEAVLVDPRSREVHVLNETGTRIWELLADGHTIAQLTERLAREFDADPTVLADEVTEFVQSLEVKGLLVRATARAA